MESSTWFLRSFSMLHTLTYLFCHQTHVWLGWFLTAIAFAFCLFGYRKMQTRNYEYSVVWETFYSTVSRPVWAAGIAWIIYASIKGHGGMRLISSSFSLMISDRFNVLYF